MSWSPETPGFDRRSDRNFSDSSNSNGSNSGSDSTSSQDISGSASSLEEEFEKLFPSAGYKEDTNLYLRL